MNIRHLRTTACTAILKTLLLTFNLIFFAIGIAFIVLGNYGLQVFKDFFLFAPGMALYIPIIIIGIFITISALMAVWCTPKELPWLLYLYGFTVFTFFTAILLISIAFMFKRTPIETEIKSSFEHGMNIYPIQRLSIDTIQYNLKCCGSENYKDWFKTNYGKNGILPDSCCVALNCTTEILHDYSMVHKQGCYQLLHTIIENKYKVIGGIGFASSGFLMVGFILACVLATHLRQNRYEHMN